jgi:hypothetical protein
MNSIKDIFHYRESIVNLAEICTALDNALALKPEIAILFSRCFRNDPSRGVPFVKLADAVKFFNSSVHQKEAIDFLQLSLTYNLINLDNLKVVYKKQTTPVYFSQRDNYREPHRTCNSSATAMAIHMINPNALSGDDEFVREVFKRGDTTIHSVVDKTCLDVYGIKCRFDTSMTYADLKSDLTKGLPVVMSIKHRGTLSNPTGGHMILAYGWIENVGIQVHDPYGNLYNGYIDGNGKSLTYKFSDLDKRWIGAFTPGHGWGRRFS